jgi:hypothetical protein
MCAKILTQLFHLVHQKKFFELNFAAIVHDVNQNCREIYGNGVAAVTIAIPINATAHAFMYFYYVLRSIDVKLI